MGKRSLRAESAMALVQTAGEIEYPESDGKPMGETDLHRDWMVRILDILRLRYRGQRVYVASDLLLYYQEGDPTKFVVPDDFVVLDCDPGRRRTFKVWDEGNKVPQAVFEVTSRATRREDARSGEVLRTPAEAADAAREAAEKRAAELEAEIQRLRAELQRRSGDG